MDLNSFKELLIKKAEGNATLQTLISFADENLLADKVLESLEKMARPHASMGRGANAAIVAFANSLKNKDVEQVRDALGHHIAHYKSALKNGNRNVADQHLNKIVPLMHLAGRASSHSGGQLGLDYVPMEPWETNYTKTDRHSDNGKLVEGTKGLGRRANPNAKYVKDYRYLEMPPHSGHADVKSSKHKGGYPFEEIQIGSPAKIDAGEAYLHIPEVEAKEKYTPHPFDMHPVHNLADLKQDKLSPQHMERFANAMNQWHDSEHSKNWNESIKNAFTQDPEAFKARSKVKPGHHFEGLELHPQPEHALQTPTIATAPTAAVKPTSASNIDYSSLPASLQAKFQGDK